MLYFPNFVLFFLISGATLSKGLYRGAGTVVGGGLGGLAAILGQLAGGIGNPVVVGISLFIFGKVFILHGIQDQSKHSNQQSSS